MGINLENRIEKLESATAEASDIAAFDLTLLTNAELIGIEARISEAAATGEAVRLTPDLEAALERVMR